MMKIPMKLQTIRLHVVQDVPPNGFQQVQVSVLQRKNMMVRKLSSPMLEHARPGNSEPRELVIR